MSGTQVKYDFRGKNIVITGATGGIGSETARQFAMAGASVLLHTNRNKSFGEELLSEIQSNGGNHGLLVADFKNREEQEQFATSVFRLFDRVDVLVNALGIDLMDDEMSKCPFEKKMQTIFNVDVFATIGLSRQISEKMRERGTGTIFFFGWDGVEFGWSGETAELYGLAKGAIQGFARSFSERLAPQVRVRTLSLGWIKTRWGQRASEEFCRRFSEDSLQNRWGTPSEVADTILFLSSDQSSFLDGNSVRLNGGKRGTKR